MKEKKTNNDKTYYHIGEIISTPRINCCNITNHLQQHGKEINPKIPIA